MKLSIILTTILSTFSTDTPDLCGDVYLDSTGVPYTDVIGQTLPRYCQWAGPNVPVWDADVCCIIDDDGASCTATDANGRCPTGDRKYCEYGALVPGGGVICYQPFPSMCDAGFCVDGPGTLPPTQALDLGCCSAGGACQAIVNENVLDCKEGGGTLLYCDLGVEHVDGTMDCWD